MPQRARRPRSSIAGHPALPRAGCALVHAEEFSDSCDNWEAAPLQGLPKFLLLVGKRTAWKIALAALLTVAIGEDQDRAQVEKETRL